MNPAALPCLYPRDRAVFHIGDLDAGHARHGSLEGCCLSVSLTPHAWRQIARLGGSPLQRLTAPEGGALAFLDWHRLRRTPALAAALERWGVAAGWCQRATVYRAWSTDEDGEWRYSEHASAEAAEAELDWLDDLATGGPNDGPAVAPVSVVAGTPALTVRMRQTDLSSRESLEFVAIAFVEDACPDLHGVWWTDRYDPDGYSAPRGGIVPSRVSGLVAETVSFDAVDNDDGLEGLAPSREAAFDADRSVAFSP